MKLMCARAAGLAAALVIPLGAWALPGLAQVPAVQEAPRYRLGPGDRLAMKVFQVEGFEAVAAVGEKPQATGRFVGGKGGLGLLTPSRASFARRRSWTRMRQDEYPYPLSPS